MNEHDLKITLEATLLAAGRPVTTQQLLDLFDERERPSKEQLQAALEQLASDYAERGIELLEVASGWRIQIRQRCIDVVSRLWQERPSKYSRALLETLALVAYRQPITRSEIEEIRGVSISSTIMRTLQERNWIRVVGHREVPGRPELLGTTREFLDYFGLKSLDQLPTLAELRDVESIGVQLELPNGEGQDAAASEDTQTAEGEGAADAAAENAAEEGAAALASAEAQTSEPEVAAGDTATTDEATDTPVAGDEVAATDASANEADAVSDDAADEAFDATAEAGEATEAAADDAADSEAAAAEASATDEAVDEDDAVEDASDDSVDDDSADREHTADDDGDPTLDASDDPELSADADEDAEDVTPTLVASSEDDASRRFNEPPRED